MFQGRINTICISEDLSKKMLPCKKETKETTAHSQTFFSFFPGGNSRRLLAEVSSANSCPEVINYSYVLYILIFFLLLLLARIH